ncbi:hypothetical protein R1flu_004077 [Riccia fluitans]|uniref:Reverse transcriptase domain-containing protein n=1 Tax=Riccia fluitans TaxID=41844 RepID=A0ABD1YP88_9MARC
MVFELLRDCFIPEDSASGFDLLFQLCTHVAQGHLSLAAARFLGASRLLAIEKDSGGVRPIAMGEALYRLVDIRNDFNIVSREAIFRKLRSALGTLDPLFPFVRSFYSQSSPLYFSMEIRTGDISTLLSEVGTRQGDPLGGVLFDLGHLRALRATVPQHLDCIFPFCADDTHIVGLVDQVLLAFHTLQDQLASVGLTIQPTKCTAWSPHGLPPSLSLPEGFRVSTTGLRILGAPLGPDSFVQTYAVETLQEALQSLHNLPLLADPQVAFGLLVHYFARRPLYLLHTTAPSPALLAVYGDFDRALLGILEA